MTQVRFPRTAGREAPNISTSAVSRMYKVRCMGHPALSNSRACTILGYHASQRRRGGMRNDPNGENVDNEKPAITLPAVVEKIVKPFNPSEPEKAQIAIHGADHLYREIRVENTLKNAAGEKVRLKPGAEVDVTIEAPVEAVEKKTP